MNLNIGCGGDPWGDVRLDLDYRTQTGVPSKLNIRADAHNLPFRDSAFDEVRCWHVLEHVKDPRRVVSEIKRVSRKASMRFPIYDGYKREMLVSIVKLSPHGFFSAFRTLKNRYHLWILTPKALGLPGRQLREPIITIYGRKTGWRAVSFLPRLSWANQWEAFWNSEDSLRQENQKQMVE